MIMRPIAVCALLLVMGACVASDPMGSVQLTHASTPTLLVTNTTCDPGPCVPLEIRGFAPKFTVPGQPAWGLVRLGSVESYCQKLWIEDMRRAANPSA